MAVAAQSAPVIPSQVVTAALARGAGPSGAARPAAPFLLRLALFGAACGSVIPLLAWVYDLGSFAGWSVLVGGPLVALTVGSAAFMTRTGRWPETRQAMTAGALGGLVGTAGYDLFRIPFVYGLGFGLLAPIDSYGVLLLDAGSSSAWTGLAGWAYHTANGVGFGVAYAVLARGRHWGYGVAWAMVLESAVVLSPFAASYGLRGEHGVQWLSIAIAYAAHVPYGLAIGRAAQHTERVVEATSVVRRPVAVVLVGVALALVGWQQPFAPDDRVRRGEEVAAGPSAVVVDGRFYPQWLRIPVEGCVVLRNTDPVEHRVGASARPLPASSTDRWCFPDAGVRRLKVDGRPFSGGYVIIDDQERP